MQLIQGNYLEVLKTLLTNSVDSIAKLAVLEGFNFIGIELDTDYLAIAKRRITAASEGLK